MTEDDALAMLEALSSNYGPAPSPESTAMWVQVLSDLEVDPAWEAVYEIVAGLAEFMPKPGQFREKVLSLTKHYDAEGREQIFLKGTGWVPKIEPGSNRPSPVENTDEVKDMIAQMRETLSRSAPRVTHSHGDPENPCPTCEHAKYLREIPLLSTTPVCQRCGVEHPRAPSCPYCGAAHYALRRDGMWLCCYCSTVFEGTREEWDNEAARGYRAAIKAQREKFLRLYHERYNIPMEDDV